MLKVSARLLEVFGRPVLDVKPGAGVCLCCGAGSGWGCGYLLRQLSPFFPNSKKIRQGLYSCIPNWMQECLFIGGKRFVKPERR